MHNYIFIKVIKLHVYMPFPHALTSVNEDIFLNSVFGRGAKWVVIMLIEPLL